MEAAQRFAEEKRIPRSAIGVLLNLVPRFRDRVLALGALQIGINPTIGLMIQIKAASATPPTKSPKSHSQRHWGQQHLQEKAGSGKALERPSAPVVYILNEQIQAAAS